MAHKYLKSGHFHKLSLHRKRDFPLRIFLVNVDNSAIFKKSEFYTLHKKISFPLRIYLVNVTRSVLLTFTKEILIERLHFLAVCKIPIFCCDNTILPLLVLLCLVIGLWTRKESIEWCHPQHEWQKYLKHNGSRQKNGPGLIWHVLHMESSKYGSIWTWMIEQVFVFQSLTLSWRRSVSYRNQSTDLLCKSMD